MSTSAAENARRDAPPIDHAAMATLGSIPAYFAKGQPRAIAMRFEGRDTDYETLERHAHQVANALAAAGCKPGDRVAYVGKNTDLFFELLFGAAKAGVVTAPIVWRLAPPEVAKIVRDTKAAILFVGADHWNTVDALRSELPGVTFMAMERGDDDVQDFAAWRDAVSDEPVTLEIPEDHVALQLYTSGTTGLPKGAMLSHANLLSGRRDAMNYPMAWNEWGPEDVSLVAMPVGHIGGSGWGLVTFFNGARAVILREFIPLMVLDAFERERVSKVFLVPTALQILVMQPRVREIDYSNLRFILYGAAPITVELLRECADVFGCGFCQQYGMTETSGTIVYLPPEDHDPRGTPRMRSAGIPLPGVEIRVVDTNRNVLPSGQTGEIETRSIANMVGYWGKPDATAQTVDSGGWLRTGDAGYLDEDGYLYIQDRYKDMICSGGENVYPAEVENAIAGHPAVQTSAVFGVPDDKWGEAVRAVVVLRPNMEANEADIIAFARTRIGGFKVPKAVEFAPALPLSPTGKVLKRVLREPYWAGRDRQVN
jgi:acyl-CoA synthetase (AMP-forming)/AMP-acid ligase II